LLTLLFLAAVWVGHAALWTYTLNLAYSRPWHKAFLRTYRALMALVIVGLPIYLVLIAPGGVRLYDVLTTWSSWTGIYALICLALGLIGVPYHTLRRWFTPRPRQILDEQTTHVDVQGELGHLPSDGGKRRWMSQLPLNQVYQVEFTTITLALPNVPPEWDGLTILQLSDLHFVGTPSLGFYRHVMDRCMADGVPDILAITGDLIDSKTHHRWVIPVLGRLRWNIAAFAILGNHDWWYDDERVRRRLRRLGMHVLGNDFTVAEVRNQPLVVIGHEGPWFRPAPDLAQCPEGFRLCLSHTPDNIRWAKRHGVDLMLSGHNHGGQIRIPGFGSIFVPSGYSRRYDMGHFDEQETFLHVNRGLGGKAPLRFFCRPQVTRIILRPAAKGEPLPSPGTATITSS